MLHDPVVADLARYEREDSEYEARRLAAVATIAANPYIAEKIVDLFAHYTADPTAFPGPAVVQSVREILDLIHKEQTRG